MSKRHKNQKKNTGGVAPVRVASGRDHLRSFAAGRHRSEETSQWWRAVGDAAFDLISLGIEPRPLALIAMSLKTKPTSQYR